jgi:hypothetical protein
MQSSPPRLRRKKACVYLKQVHGIDRAPATLAKLASVGGGPKFEHIGRVPVYPIQELDNWATKLISALKSSTSDPGAESVRCLNAE